MRRILFYTALLIQLVVITVFIFQFERIHVTGTEIQIVTKETDAYGEYDYPLYQDAFVEYDISVIPEEKWTGSTDMNYNEKIYVLLEKGDNHVYEVKEASDNRLETKNKGSIVIPAFYGYFDQQMNFHEVNYDFQYIRNIDRFGSFQYSDKLIVSLYVSQWGQYKIIDVTVYDKK